MSSALWIADSDAGPPRKPMGRPPNRRRQVAAILRNRIREKVWGPGERLLSRRELIEELGVSTSVLQSAIDQLHAEGFIEKCPGDGTYVSLRPPYMYQHALVLPESKHYFYRLLEREALARYEADHHHRFKVYHLPHDHSVSATNAFKQLATDVEHHSVASMIISVGPSIAQREVLALADQSGLPVALHGTQEEAPGLPIVRADQRAFFDMAVGRLRSQGRSRVALLCESQWYDRVGRDFDVAMSAAGLPLNPIWLQHVNPGHTRAIRNLIRLWMTLSEALRPDGVIVIDSNAAGCIASVLAELGLQPGRELDVVVSTNYPLGESFSSDFGFTWLGFDVERIFDAFLEVVLQANPRDGRSYPRAGRPNRVILIPPRFLAAEGKPVARVSESSS